MIVVADSGPLHYLILLDQAPLLHRFYGRVLVPEAVAVELRAARAPQPVRAWMFHPPSWIEIAPVSANEMAPINGELGLGERAAIALAERVHAELMLIDETEGRIEAARRGLRVTGTLGVLLAAAEEGLVDVPDVLNRLAATTFYADERLLTKVFGKWLGA